MLSLRRKVIYLFLFCTVLLIALSQWIAISTDQMADQVTEAPADQKFLYAAFATCMLLLALIGIRVATARIDRLFDRWHTPVLHELRMQHLEVVSSNQIRSAMHHALHTLRFVASVVVIGIYLSRILVLFPEAEPLALELQHLIRAPLEKMWQAFLAYLPTLFEIAVILTVTRYLLKLIHLFFHALGIGIIVVRGFYPDWAEPTYKIVRILALVFVAFIIMPLLPGSDSQFFEGISFFLGLLVSLGSTSVIKHMTAGMVLTYTRSFQIGDRIRVNGSVGDVLEKSLFVTRIQTIKNERIAIPNSLVLDNEITNYTAMAATEGPDPLHLDHDRLRCRLAPGARADDRGGAGNRGYPRGPGALRAPDQPRRLLRVLPDQRLHQPARSHGGDLLRAAPAHSRRVPRRRSGDHVTGLYRPAQWERSGYSQAASGQRASAAPEASAPGPPSSPAPTRARQGQHALAAGLDESSVPFPLLVKQGYTGTYLPVATERVAMAKDKDKKSEKKKDKKKKDKK